MSSDYTQQQSTREQLQAEQLSLTSTVPPGEAPGYRLERLLGQGAFGQVWIGTDLNTGRTVAVKFYLHRGGVNWSQLSREVKHLVSMSANRYIVQVLEVGWDSHPPYYVMEYIENGSLEDLMRARGPLTVPQTVSLFTDVARGLNHSHGKGVLHCDLKPANVLLDQDHRPRLADFGQSRMSHDQTPSLGTLFYMAPEQADLQAVPDARWDVYAIGAIGFCLLVGYPPYRSPHLIATLDTCSSLPQRLERYRDLIARAPVPREHYRVPGIDRPLAQIIDRCLAKNPKDRFENVQQLLEALQQREQARARRPLMILGILGPLVLMALMGWSSWTSIKTATGQSERELQQWALKSNQFAAQLAARTLESEVNLWFRQLEAQAANPQLLNRLEQLIDQQADDLQRLAATAVSSPDHQAAVEQFRSSPAAISLQELLERQLAQLLDTAPPATEPLSNGSPELRGTRFDSLLVLDRHGHMLAAAFDAESLQEPDFRHPAGENFSFRSYFTGLPTEPDRPAVSATASPPAPLTAPHVSVPFRSQSTGRWKIAVSAPILNRPDHAAAAEQNRLTSAIAPAAAPPAPQESRVIGVVALTINLGDVDLLAEPSRGDETPSRFAVVIDGHAAGQRQGTILQHPHLADVDRLVRHYRQEDRQRANQIARVTFQIPPKRLQQLQQQTVFDYEDPVRTGGLPGSERFAGRWLATMEPVGGRGAPGQGRGIPDRTELFVMVQERVDTISQPVGELAQRLIRQVMVAGGLMLLVVGGLWLSVLRLFRIARLGGSGPGGPTETSTTPGQLAQTLPHDPAAGA
jgi:eukaryotic-like serine/threonine-protein kinase